MPYSLWEIVEPWLPARVERAAGRGPRHVNDRPMSTAVVYVLTAGCAWRHLSGRFGVSKATAQWRLAFWTEAGYGTGCTVVLDHVGRQVYSAPDTLGRGRLDMPAGL